MLYELEIINSAWSGLPFPEKPAVAAAVNMSPASAIGTRGIFIDICIVFDMVVLDLDSLTHLPNPCFGGGYFFAC